VSGCQLLLREGGQLLGIQSSKVEYALKQNDQPEKKFRMLAHNLIPISFANEHLCANMIQIKQMQSGITA
jgi:hypothetical protein